MTIRLTHNKVRKEIKNVKSLRENATSWRLHLHSGEHQHYLKKETTNMRIMKTKLKDLF